MPKSPQVIIQAAGYEPWPICYTRLQIWVAVGVEVGYKTLDDTTSSVITYAEARQNSLISDYEKAQFAKIIEALKRKGHMSHRQKKPVFLEHILAIGDAKARGELLLAFMFGLRKSEATLINDTIPISFCEESIALNYEDADLKSNLYAGARIKCLCSVNKRMCLHSYKDHLLSVKGINLLDRTKGIGGTSGQSSHSIRIGATITLHHTKVDAGRIVLHQRWSSGVMLNWYLRRMPLHEKPKILTDYTH